MSDLDLPPKRKIPKWVWILGGGCLVVGIGFVVALILLLGFVKRANDPAEQWPKLEAHLSVAHQPEGWTIAAMPMFGDADVWKLQPPDSSDEVFVWCYPKSIAASFRKSLFEEVELSADAPLVGPVGRFDPLRGKVTVQGRELDCLRYFTTPDSPETTDGFLGAVQTATSTSNLLVDVSTDPDGDLITVEIKRGRTRQRIPDEDLVELLEPFRIGTP